MSRLLIAIFILIAVLLGLKFISSPFFQQNILNRIGASSQTQTTGFNTSVPADISSDTPIQPNPASPVPAQPNNTGSGNAGSGNSGDTSNGNTSNGNTGSKPTPSVPSLRPIPGGW
jgi:hypothetical protein